MKKLFRKTKKKLRPLVLIPIVLLAVILTGGYFLFLAGDDDDTSKASSATPAPPATGGPSKTKTTKKDLTPKPEAAAGKEFTIDSDRAEKDYATVNAIGAIKTPASISARFGAAPKQPVTVNSSITCLLATEGARYGLDTFTVTPPAARELKLPVPVQDAISCTTSVTAQLTRPGEGRIKVFLIGVRRAGE